MSVSCNGANSLASNVPKNFVESVEKCIPHNNIANKNFPLEEGFKGFEKCPVVVLPRYDITPYLKRKEPYSEKPNQCCDLSFHSERLQLSCVVCLVRNDLEKLKNEHEVRSSSCVGSVARNDLEQLKNAYKFKGPVLNDPESSGSDSEIDVNMASKCNICEKLYSSEKKLLKHQSKKHMIVYENKPQKRVSFSDQVIVHELKEYHKCRKCTNRFEDYKSLKCHMKRYHKKRKCYICNYCNKRFKDRMFFKVHIKLHCDVCGLLFRSRVQYLEHKRICRVFNLHKCKLCERSFFSLMDLKDHNYEHLNFLLICDICKDQFNTKCGLAHHLSFLHAKQRPSSMYIMRNLGSERLYLCNFCDESSVDKEIIEYHLQSLPDLTNRAMTGYKDYYFCDQCMKKFETETDMLQHKWTHFLKTSDNSQIRMSNGMKNNMHQSKTSTLQNNLYQSKTTAPQNNMHKSKTSTLLNNMHQSKTNAPQNNMYQSKSTALQNYMHQSKTTALENNMNQSKITILQNNMHQSKTTALENNMNQSKITILQNNMHQSKTTILENNMHKSKTTYKSGDKLPESMNPSVVLERLDIIDTLDGSVKLIDLSRYYTEGNNKKAIVDSKSRKTILSKHQCQICSKYYSSSYCLNRHIDTQHMTFNNLQCKVCEEIFAWPSLLKNHKCLRYNHPEMPFEDARPEIHFDNIHQLTSNGLDDFSIADSDDYLNSVDFEIPAPIVELTEGEGTLNCYNNFSGPVTQLDKSYATPLQSLGYKLVMQEVPIEF